MSTVLLAQSYRVTGSIPVAGTGAWDYLASDAGARRLFVSHSDQVIVIDLNSGKPLKTLSGFGFVHGIVLANDLNAGFISDGDHNEVDTFDLTTLKLKRRIKTLSDPNSMVYDRSSGRLFAGHKSKHAMTAINASTGRIEGIIQLGGIPEFPVTDGRGNVFVNIEDKSEILKIDSKTLAIRDRWSLAPCESPSGLAFDLQQMRLFAACDNNLMAVVDASSGKVIATPAIGGGPDAAVFDPNTKLIFSSNGDGTLTVIRQRDHNTYKVVQTVRTESGARTMALDATTHKIYLSTAKLGPRQIPDANHPHTHPTAVAGTFKVLIVSP